MAIVINFATRANIVQMQIVKFLPLPLIFTAKKEADLAGFNRTRISKYLHF